MSEQNQQTSGQEPIYQIRRLDGAWVDVEEHGFETIRSVARRIVYAAPAPVGEPADMLEAQYNGAKVGEQVGYARGYADGVKADRQGVALSDETHRRYAGWMVAGYPPLDQLAFNTARANMGTTSHEQDAALYRAILAYVAASRASSSRAEVEIPAALEVVEAWGYDEGGQWDQGYAEGWNACRDAMLAAAEERRDA